MDGEVQVNRSSRIDAVDYVHRIGRTGRAGASGLAVSLVTPASEAHFRLIEKRRNLSLPREQVEGFEPAAEEAAKALRENATPGAGGIKGRRPSKKDKLRAAAADAAAKQG